MLGVGSKWRHVRGSDTSKTKWVEVSLCFFASEEQQTPSSGLRLPPSVQTLGFLCTEVLTNVVGFAQIPAMSLTSEHIAHDLTAWRSWAISHTATLPSEQGFARLLKSGLLYQHLVLICWKRADLWKKCNVSSPPCTLPTSNPKKGLKN